MATATKTVLFPAMIDFIRTCPPAGEYIYCQWPDFKVKIMDSATKAQIALEHPTEPGLVFYRPGFSEGPGHIEYKKIEILENGLWNID